MPWRCEPWWCMSCAATLLWESGSVLNHTVVQHCCAYQSWSNMACRHLVHSWRRASNVVQFQGACVAEGCTMLVTEFMEVCIVGRNCQLCAALAVAHVTCNIKTGCYSASCI